MAAGSCGLSRGLHQSWPWPERVSQRGSVWCGAALAAAPADHRRPPVRRVVVQAAIGAGRAVRAACSGAVANDDGGAATAMALAGASFVLFGHDAWSAFIASTEMSRKILLEEGSVGFEKLQSAFAAVRLWSGSIGQAYLAQGAIAVVAICATARAWYSDRDRDTKAALLLAATTLASPHILDYDL